MICSDVQDQLSAYMDKMLSVAQMKAIDEHLSHCPDCRRELRQLEETVALLHQMGEVEPPPDLTEAIINTIQSSAKKDRGRISIWRRLQDRKSLGGLIAVAACLLIAAVIVGRGFPGFKMAADGGGVTEEAAGGMEMNNTPALPGDAPADIAMEMPANMQMRMYAEEKGLDLAPARASVEKSRARKVIKRAHLTLLVEDVDGGFEQILNLVEDAGGFIQNSGVWENEKQRTSNLTLRVPVDRFSQVLAGLEDLGKVEGRELDGQDVTTEYIDTEARLRNLERQEERFLEILQQADTVEEILNIERELERVRGEIEAFTAHLKNLDDLVGFSTIDIVLRQLKVSARRIDAPGLPGVLNSAFQASIRTFNGILGLLADLVVLLGGIIPLLPFFFLAYFGYRWYGKRKGKKRE